MNTNTNQKPHKDPTPEERSRIVSSIMAKVEAKDAQATGSSELEQLSKMKNEARAKVNSILVPIIEQANMLPTKDPRYSHSTTGKLHLIATAQRLYLEEIRKWNREEALWLLSFAYAELNVAEHI